MLNPKLFASQLLFALLCILCALCFSCQADPESKLALSNTFLIKGKLETANLSATDPEFSFIDSKGLRTRVTNYKWNQASGEFELKFYTSDLKPYEPRIWPALLKMSKTPLEDKARVRRRAELTFEVLLREAADLKGISQIMYSQKRIALVALDEISGNQLIDLGTVQLRKALSVRSKLEKAIQGQGKDTEEFGIFIPFSKEVSESPNTPWDFLSLAPVQLFPSKALVSATNSGTPLMDEAGSETSIVLEPIPEQVPEFYFYYQQSLGCSQILGKYTMSEYLKAPTIKLIPCEQQDTQPKAESATLRASYNESAKLVLAASKVKGTYGNEPYLFTNSTVANINIVAKQLSATSALRIAVYNSDATDIEPIAVNELKVFTSQFGVDLPTTFSSAAGFQSENGSFAIKITSLDNKNTESLLLRGFKSLARPGLVGDNLVEVVSENEEFNLVNGAAGTLLLKSRFCDESLELQRTQRKIGVSLLSLPLEASILYANCPSESSGTLAYSVDELLARSNLTKSQNILTDLRFFLVNEFGGRSENDLVDNKNTVKVYFDFTQPSLSASGYSLGQQLGITAAQNSSSKSETSYCNFIYLNCNFSTEPANKGPTRLKFDAAGLVTNAIFRFADQKSCELSPSSADGAFDPYAKLSAKITSFELAPQSETFRAAMPTVPCGNDYDLRSLGLQMPARSTDKIFFQLRVTDGSGVQSQAASFGIEPCDSSNAKNETVCWEK